MTAIALYVSPSSWTCNEVCWFKEPPSGRWTKNRSGILLNFNFLGFMLMCAFEQLRICGLSSLLINLVIENCALSPSPSLWTTTSSCGFLVTGNGFNVAMHPFFEHLLSISHLSSSKANPSTAAGAFSSSTLTISSKQCKADPVSSRLGRGAIKSRRELRFCSSDDFVIISNMIPGRSLFGDGSEACSIALLRSLLIFGIVWKKTCDAAFTQQISSPWFVNLNTPLGFWFSTSCSPPFTSSSKGQTWFHPFLQGLHSLCS